MKDENRLKLENQLCFPLYAVSKEIIKKYKTFLDKIDLTYTQYIVMLVLFEEKSINVKNLGEKLFLDSGTLTPLLKKLELKGYINRERMESDERNLNISITEKGIKLKESCLYIPLNVGKCIDLTEEETLTLYRILYKILKSIND